MVGSRWRSLNSTSAATQLPRGEEKGMTVSYSVFRQRSLAFSHMTVFTR